jgi:hypothetical protein
MLKYAFALYKYNKFEFWSLYFFLFFKIYPSKCFVSSRSYVGEFLADLADLSLARVDRVDYVNGICGICD